MQTRPLLAGRRPSERDATPRQEATPEALDHGHRVGLAVLDAAGPGGARIEGEERADRHAAHGAAQRVVPGQAVAVPEG